MSFTDSVLVFFASLLEEFAIMVVILACFAGVSWYRKYRRRLPKSIPAKSVWESQRKFDGHKKARSNFSTASTTDDSDPTIVCDDTSDTESAYSTRSRLSNRRKPTHNRTQQLQRSGVMDANLEKVLEKLDPQDVAVVRALLSSKEREPYRKKAASKWQNRPIIEARDDTENSLRTNLRKLASIDTARIMMVKKISKLGLYSPQLLTDYFSKFGPVTEVFVTHAIDKRADRLKPRVRPASIGFVVMDEPKAASAALILGTSQDVNGVMIYVGTYENVSPKDAQEAMDDDKADEDANDDGEDAPG